MQAQGAPELWRVVMAEAIGAALLVLLSCLPACEAAPPPAPTNPPAHRALAAGLVVLLLVQCFDHVSGAMFNPAVVLAALVARRVRWPLALAMTGAQLAGSVAGGAMLRLASASGPAACVTRPAPNLASYQALGIEAVLGGCLALANWAAWDARTRGAGRNWPLRIGGIVAGLSLAAGELTGASMNPARSLGPALWSGDWTAHWVYWAGPLAGSLCCSALYLVTWRAPPHPHPPHTPHEEAVALAPTTPV